MFFKISRDYGSRDVARGRQPALQSLPLVQIALENKDRG